MASINLSSIGTILNDIASVPGGWSLFHTHLSGSDEGRAIGLIDNIQNSPTNAATYVDQLSQISGMPPQVLQYVDDAIADPTAPSFKQNLTQAKAALAAAVSSKLLGMF